jgi:hypothetical protein
MTLSGAGDADRIVWSAQPAEQAAAEGTGAPPTSLSAQPTIAEMLPSEVFAQRLP